jgi:uncharacterized protein
MNALLAARAAAGTFRVKMIPKAHTTAIAGELADGTLKVRVAAAPVRGKANAALCDFLARELGVARTSVEVVSGQTSTLKLVRVRRS